MIRPARILTSVFSALLALAAGVAAAAEFRPAAHEVWTGTYRCEAIERDPDQWPAYSAPVRLTLEGGRAQVARETARVQGSLSGEVAPDGTVRLEGTGGARDGSARWRYRFEGRFEGERFTAKGAMLSAASATKIRDCSMALTRAKAAGAPARAQPVAPAPPQPVPARPEPKAGEPAATPSAPVKVREGRALDFTQGNDTAVIQGEISREVPHRYPVVAKKGQTLSATLQADGVRLDVYEPGATLEMQAHGFVVQGTRLKGAPDGASISAELPGDGSYLLLVRALREQASYTLEVAVRATDRARPVGLLSGDRTLWAALLAALAAIGAGLVIYSKRDRRMFRPR